MIIAMTLSIHDTLQKLSAYENLTYPILSVYINTFHKDHPDMLKNFRHLVVDYLSSEEQEAVKQNISYIQGFLETFPTPQDCKTLVLFSGGDHLWEVVTTDIEIPEQITVSHSPFTAPLEKTLDTYKNYLVLLADKEKALLLKMREGILEEKKEVLDESMNQEVPQKMKGRNNNMRSGKIDRHIQEHLHRHFQHIGKEVDHFLEGENIAGVLIGSHQQLIHPLEENLSLQTKEKILGEFIADLNAPLDDLLAKSTEVLAAHHLMKEPNPPILNGSVKP